MSLENYLKNPIPFGEACAFLVEFHKLGSEMEGVTAPPPDTLGLYAAVAQAEFKSIFAYTVYSETLRGLERNSLAEEFQDHADEELEHVEWVLRRMATLGGPPPLQDVPMPPPASDPIEVVQNLIQIEQEGIAAWQALHAVLGDDPARFTVEEYLAVEQERLDDMLRLLPAAPAPMPAPSAAPAPAEGGASVKVDLKPGEKTAAVRKTGFAERLLPGTESYYSDRMLSVLQGMAPKVFTPEGAMDGVGEKTANKFERRINIALPIAGATLGALLGHTHRDDPDIKKDRGKGGLSGLMADHPQLAGAVTGAAVMPATFHGLGLAQKYLGKHAAAFKRAADELMAAQGELPPQQGTQAGSQLQADPTMPLDEKVAGSVEEEQRIAKRAPIFGALGGGLMGAAWGNHVAKNNHQTTRRLATAVGALAGGGAGAIGAHLGSQARLRRAEQAAEEKRAAAFKRAAAELMAASAGELPPQQGTTVGSQLQADPNTSAYLQNEMEGQAAQEQNEAEFYKQRFMEAQQQLEAATQASEQAAAQAQQLQQQAEQNQMALSSAQSQAQQTSALAMQQVMQAGDEKLKEQMQAAQMRMAFQDLRGQLLNLASQEPPAQVLIDPSAMGPQAGAAAGTQAMGGQPPAETQPQDAASAPAGQAPDAQAAPGQPGPGGAQTVNEGGEASEPAGKGKGSTSVTVKQGSFRDHALGAGLGALVGGGVTALEAGGGDGMREGLRKKISVLEQEQNSFPQAMRLVANKALLGASEAASAHPVGATIVGSLAGAGIGAATEPAVRSLVESGRRLLR